MNQQRIALGYKCFHCGTSLPLRRVGKIRCPQCGGENFIELPSSASPASSGGVGGGTAVALVVLSGLTLLFAGLFFSGIDGRQLLGRPRPTVSRPADPIPEAPAEESPKGGFMGGIIGSKEGAEGIISWVGAPASGGPQFVDADGDGSPDLVGFGVTGGKTQLLAVQARTGAILWRNDSVSDPGRYVYSDGVGGLVLGSTKDFSLTALDPRSGNERWRQRLSDKPEAVSFGEGCLLVRAADGKKSSFLLATGATGDCPGAPPPTPPWERKSRPLRAGSVDLAFSSTTPGTPRVIVKATKGGQKLWEQTLPIATESAISQPGDVPAALLPAGLVVAGKPPGEEALAVLLVDLETGAIKASHTLHQKEMHGSFFVRLAPAGQVVVVETFGKAYGLLLPSLDPRWEAGSMW